jgi:hypothetical protein
MGPEQILKSLRRKKDYEDLGRGAMAEEISRIESTLSVFLPTEYKDFLSRVGFIFWFGNTVLGVAPEEYDSVVFWTTKARNDRLPSHFHRWPSDTVVVKHYGGGGYYFLFCGGSRSGQVALLLDELDGAEAQAWGNFWLFLKQFVRAN